ncbi:MAG: hypothetical protein AAFV33_13950, partial [Chloroflexota bacterium]
DVVNIAAKLNTYRGKNEDIKKSQELLQGAIDNAYSERQLELAMIRTARTLASTNSRSQVVTDSIQALQQLSSLVKRNRIRRRRVYWSVTIAILTTFCCSAMWITGSITEAQMEQTATVVAQTEVILAVTEIQLAQEATQTATLWTPTPTDTATATPTITPTASETSAPTVTPTASETATPTITLTASETSAPTVALTAKETATPNTTQTQLAINNATNQVILGAINESQTESAVVMSQTQDAATQIVANEVVEQQTFNTGENRVTTDLTTFYTEAQANIRTCPRLSDECSDGTFVFGGTELISIGYVDGDEFSGSTRWYIVEYNGIERYVHSELLTRTRPQPTSPPVSNAQSGSSSSSGSSASAVSGAAPACMDGFDWNICLQYEEAPGSCDEVVARGIPERAAACCFPARDRDKDGLACYGT